MSDERLRQCIACRQLNPRGGMLRVTRSKDGRVAVDNSPPLEGRSAYVCRKTACLADAVKGKKFQRTLKRALPDDIVETLSSRLRELESQ